MECIRELIVGKSLAHAIIALVVVAAVGMALGNLRIHGIGLGVAGVLFVALAAAHFGLVVDPHILEFARELGLILFVFTIGLQVGPGFFNSLRRQGLLLNTAAAAIVFVGTALAVLLWTSRMNGRADLPAAAGLLSGAVTNTPSLAAAQQSIRDLGNFGEAASPLAGMAYAVAYPFGVFGIMLTMLIVRRLFRIDLDAEVQQLKRQTEADHVKLATASIEITNANLFGRCLCDVPLLHEGSQSGVVVSRLLRDGVAEPATHDAQLSAGDVVFAVGPQAELDDLVLVLGRHADIDVRTVGSSATDAAQLPIIAREVLVTRTPAVGRTVHQLNFQQLLGVNVTRIFRSGVQLPVTPSLRFQFADRVVLVGYESFVQEAAGQLGNNRRDLDQPNILAMLVGIALGVLVGSVPIFVPGLPAPVKLGLAGGPLLMAIVLSRLGKLGPLLFYLPGPANIALRELGIALFLACVGLKAGGTFVQTLHGSGIQWLWMGATITLVPMLTTAIVLRGVFRLNYLSLCGLLAGSATDPPALAFAMQHTSSDAPSVSYAAVYPVAMFLRVLCAQASILLLA
ncbi:putative transporter [soil metagenome]